MESVPSDGLLLFAFVATAMYGAFAGFRSLRRIRQPHPYADTMFRWHEAPLSSFRYERPNWVAVAAHSVAIVLIGLITLAELRDPTALLAPMGNLSPWFLPLFLGVVMAGTAYIGFVWGLTIFQPIAQRVAGSAHFALSEEGLLFGGLLFPWESFDRFSCDPSQTAVRLWSAFSPMTVSFTFSPLPGLTAVLRSRLKSTESPLPTQGLSALAFPASMCLASLLGVLLVVGMNQALGSLAVPLNAILLFVFVRATTWLMFKFSSDGKQRPAPLEKSAV